MAGRLSRFLICLVLSPAAAGAGPILDFIRSYDLNDYALGVAFSASHSPYVGAATSVFPYPYLTSFRDSAFTRDWVLLAEGDVGFRYVTKSEWEFGLVGRLQTLGLGNEVKPELRGLDDRAWTIEMAPMIGYRGWPIHINARTYFEVLGRHDGTVSQLTFSLPREYERGFLVPSVRALHRDAAYTDHYFGVSQFESRPNRPEYSPGSSTSWDARIRWGYAISDKWLLSGAVGVEFLDSVITDSPIVGRDETWFGNIGIAYNSDIFRPRVSDTGKRQPRFEIRVGAFSDTGDAVIIRDDQGGAPGDEIDLEDVLGVSENETVFVLDVIYRFNPFHRLEVGYHELIRKGTATLDRDVRFGETTFAQDSVLNTAFRSEILRFSYAFSLMNDEQKELGVMAGVHVTNGDTEIYSQTTGDVETSDMSTPLPVVGLHGALSTGPNSALGARAQIFAMEFDRVSGHMIYLMLEWQRTFRDRFSAGVAYNFYRTDLESSDRDVSGRFQTTHHGPALFISANF